MTSASVRLAAAAAAAAATAALVFPGTAGIADDARSSNSNNSNNDKCRLYLAPSTIPNAGLGVFTSIPLRANTPLPPSGGDGAIAIPDLDFHNNGSSDKEDYHWLPSEYTWSPQAIGDIMNYEAEKTSAYAWGNGALPNSHLWIHNIFESEAEFDTLGIERSNSPGAGAFTGYHNRISYALEDIKAGSELFVSYGFNWFQTRESYMGLVPSEIHYARGENFVKKVYELFDFLISTREGKMLAGETKVAKEEVEEYISYTEQVQADIWNIIITHPFKSRPLAALPKTFEAAIRAMDVGISQTEEELATRSIEYLEKNGKCLDHIQSGNSAIPHAGRGAFATRYLPRGTVVSYAPLLHIPDKDILVMYADTEDGEKRDKSKPIGHQLLLNYCWGNPSSSLLLCPYSHGTPMINHNGQDPNVKIQWAENDERYHNSSWLNESVTFFDSVWNTRIILEYVALRDIQEGEEVLVDYGKEWEDSWREHVKNWKPVENYTSPHVLNSNYDIPLPTYEEDQSMYEDIEGWYTDDKGGDHAINRFLVRHPDLYNDDEEDDTSFVYDVEFKDSSQVKVARSVPRHRIHFYHKPYKGDTFFKGSFRHEMVIPDEIFPDAWRNL